MPESKIPADKKSQLERFKEAAKLTGTDDSEERFDRVLKKVAKPSGRTAHNSDRARKTPNGGQ
jgi:hypothetical protein